MLVVPTGKEMSGAQQDSSTTSPCFIDVLLAIGHTRVTPPMQKQAENLADTDA